MKITKLLILLIIFIPILTLIPGCSSDTFLDSIREEEDFVAPFDVILSDTFETFRTTYFQIPPVDTTGNYTLNPDTTTPGEVYDGADNVVLDNTTGLMWTRCAAYMADPDSIPDSGDEYYDMDNTVNCSRTPAKMPWIKAAQFCKETLNNKNYAGYNDWTVPKVSELTSIINFNAEQSGPQIDTTVFPNTVNSTDEGYWSFTSKLFIGNYYETIDYGWIVFFRQSSPGFQNSSFTNSTDYRRKFKDDLSSETQYIRCVRGGVEEPF